MTDLMDEWTSKLEGKTIGELFNRRQELIGAGPTTNLSDEVLQELLAIARVLRKRSSAPQPKKSAKAAAPSLDAL